MQDLVEESISSNDKLRHFDIRYEAEKLDISEKLEKIRQIPQKNLKMELAYKLLDDGITGRLKGNLTKQKDFQEEIEKTLSKYHGKFADYETLFPQFEKTAQKVSEEAGRAKQLQMTDEEIAFYDVIMMGKEYLESDKIARDIAIAVVDYLKNNLKIDWLNQQNVQDAISVGVTKILLKKDFPHEKIEEIVPMIMEQTKANYADIGFQ